MPRERDNNHPPGPADRHRVSRRAGGVGGVCPSDPLDRHLPACMQMENRPSSANIIDHHLLTLYNACIASYACVIETDLDGAGYVAHDTTNRAKMHGVRRRAIGWARRLSRCGRCGPKSYPSVLHSYCTPDADEDDSSDGRDDGGSCAARTHARARSKSI